MELTKMQPRHRALALLMLAHPGDGYKQLAYRMGVTVASLRMYAHELYKALGVNRRGEVMVMVATTPEMFV